MGSGKTGLQGVFYPLRNKSISCSYSYSSGSASVDANGTLTLGAYWLGLGWSYTTNAAQKTSTGTAFTRVAPTGIQVIWGATDPNNPTPGTDYVACSANWPST